MRIDFRVWGIPLALAALIIFGLLSALLGTGLWHILSWIALTIPVWIVIRYGLIAKRRK